MAIEEAAADYCREVEAYLCRKNDGHLVRIVGPAFEQVCGWSARGVPLKVACRGIDRYFERYYAKGPRRRPVRIEFCEADVLDLFDEWRRAVGVTATSADPATRPTPSLPSHLERVVARLTALRAGNDRQLDDLVEPLAREIDAMRGPAKGARGEQREQLLARLRVLDEELTTAVRGRYDAAALEQLGAEADAELAPYRDRMPPDAYRRSRAACVDRLLRDRLRLPIINFD